MNSRVNFVKLACWLVLIGLASGGDDALGAAISIDQLSAQTPTTTFNEDTIPDARFNDDAIDGDADIDSTASVTVAFEATLKSTPGENRVLFEFGGGGTGMSMLMGSGGQNLTLQVRDGSNANQMGGNDSALSFDYTDLFNQESTFVASLEVDSTDARLRMFIDGQFIGAVTGETINDWAGTNNGRFFHGNNDVLNANFGTSNFKDPKDSEAVAGSDLRVYQDLSVVGVTEPIVGLPATYAFQSNETDADTAFGDDNYVNLDTFLTAGAGPQVLTDTATGKAMELTVTANGDLNFAGELGVGVDQNGDSWDTGDILDLVFTKPVTLDKVWINHGQPSGQRSLLVRAVVNPGASEEIQLGTLSMTKPSALQPYALDFGGEVAGDVVIEAGAVLRLFHSGQTSDGGRIAGVTVIMVPSPGAMPAALVVWVVLAMRRRRAGVDGRPGSGKSVVERSSAGRLASIAIGGSAMKPEQR